eukprot:3334116-Rhodomonas_salina.4
MKHKVVVCKYARELAVLECGQLGCGRDVGCVGPQLLWLSVALHVHSSSSGCSRSGLAGGGGSGVMTEPKPNAPLKEKQKAPPKLWQKIPLKVEQRAPLNVVLYVPVQVLLGLPLARHQRAALPDQEGQDVHSRQARHSVGLHPLEVHVTVVGSQSVRVSVHVVWGSAGHCWSSEMCSRAGRHESSNV